jgi:hypothetical protein
MNGIRTHEGLGGDRALSLVIGWTVCDPGDGQYLHQLLGAVTGVFVLQNEPI